MRKAMLGNEIIDLDKLTKPEIMRLNKRQAFFCATCCKKPVIFKNGTKKKAHFAHEKEGDSTTRPESAAHILVKHSMERWLRRQGINATVERRFGRIDRIADVYFEYQNRKYVLEIQKSPMSHVEFKQRVSDYRSIGVIVLWIFLGDVVKKEHTFRLPSVMLGRGLERLFHFCDKTIQLQIFELPAFVTTRDVYARTVCKQLREFQIEELLKEEGNSSYFERSWVEIKAHFRKCGWHYASKSEKKLVEQCLIRGFNLSLLPTEIGWPVVGNGIGKHLFVWQSYVLLTLMKYFKLADVFAAGELLRLIGIEYHIEIDQTGRKQVLAYLRWLVMFGIVKKEDQYFRYVKMPKISGVMVKHLSRDKKFVEVVANLWQV